MSDIKSDPPTFATLLDRYRVALAHDNNGQGSRQANREMNDARDALFAFVAALEHDLWLVERGIKP